MHIASGSLAMIDPLKESKDATFSAEALQRDKRNRGTIGSNKPATWVTVWEGMLLQR
jgi:hypothetical protein